MNPLQPFRVDINVTGGGEFVPGGERNSSQLLIGSNRGDNPIITLVNHNDYEVPVKFRSTNNRVIFVRPVSHMTLTPGQTVQFHIVIHEAGRERLLTPTGQPKFLQIYYNVEPVLGQDRHVVIHIGRRCP